LIKDRQIHDENKKNEIINYLKDIDYIHGEVLQNTSYSILLNLNSRYGNVPKLNLNTLTSNTIESNTKIFENISFYYLNVIKSNEKNQIYESTDILLRLKWYVIL
jgi:hypothetical protein